MRLKGESVGAGTYANSDGSRQPTGKELEMAREQGKAFWSVVSRAFP